MRKLASGLPDTRAILANTVCQGGSVEDSGVYVQETAGGSLVSAYGVGTKQFSSYLWLTLDSQNRKQKSGL